MSPLGAFSAPVLIKFLLAILSLTRGYLRSSVIQNKNKKKREEEYKDVWCFNKSLTQSAFAPVSSYLHVPVIPLTLTRPQNLTYEQILCANKFS